MDFISPLVQKELKETASLVPFLTDYSGLAGKGVKQIEIPKLSSFTVQDRAFGAAATENAALTDATDVIALDKNKIVLFGYDSKDAIQSSIEYLSNAARRAASAHGRQVNSDILATWDSVADLSVNGGAPADITVDDILAMRRKLQENFADMNRVALIIGPDQEEALLKIDEFRRFDIRGGGEAPVVNGMLGRVYGIPVVINTQVAAQQGYMVEQSGSGIAFQAAPSIEEEKALEYGTGGKRVAVDQLYGLGGLQLGEGNASSGTVSPLITKLRD